MKIALALLVCLPPTAARAGVHVVDPGPGADGAALLQAAVDAAQDGDVILLKAGDYVGSGLPPLGLAGKSLALMADDGLAPLAVRSANVNSLPGGGVVVLRGLRFATASEATSTGGPVLHQAASIDIVGDGPSSLCWIEDCEVLGADELLGGVNGLGLTGLYLQAVPGPGVGIGTDVVAVRSLFRGAQGNTGIFGAGGHGAYIEGGSAAFLQCTLLGGDGNAAAFPTLSKADGGHGCYALFSWLYVSGSTFQGGAEGLDSPQATVSGSGLQLLFAISEGWLRDTSLQAGAVQGASGTQGPALVNPAQDIVFFPAASRALSVPALCHEGSAVVVKATGVAGDLAALLLSAEPQWGFPIAARQGPLLLDPLTVVGPILLGAIRSADGVLESTFSVPSLPPGLDAQLLFGQGLFAGSDGVTLGSGSASCWIAAGL